jgi:hypothetical protein
MKRGSLFGIVSSCGQWIGLILHLGERNVRRTQETRPLIERAGTSRSWITFELSERA